MVEFCLFGKIQCFFSFYMYFPSLVSFIEILFPHIHNTHTHTIMICLYTKDKNGWKKHLYCKQSHTTLYFSSIHFCRLFVHSMRTCIQIPFQQKLNANNTLHWWWWINDINNNIIQISISWCRLACLQWKYCVRAFFVLSFLIISFSEMNIAHFETPLANGNFQETNNNNNKNSSGSHNKHWLSSSPVYFINVDRCKKTHTSSNKNKQKITLKLKRFNWNGVAHINLLELVTFSQW